MSNDNEITPQGIWASEFKLRSVEWTDNDQNQYRAFFLMSISQSYAMDSCGETGEDLFDYVNKNGAKLHNGVQNGVTLPAYQVVKPNGECYEGYFYNGSPRNQTDGPATRTFDAQGTLISGYVNDGESFRALTDKELAQWNLARTSTQTPVPNSADQFQPSPF